MHCAPAIIDLRGPPWSSIFLSVKILLVFGGSGRSSDCRGAAECRLALRSGGGAGGAEGCDAGSGYETTDKHGWTPITHARSPCRCRHSSPSVGNRPDRPQRCLRASVGARVGGAIGDEPGTIGQDQDPAEKAICEGEDGAGLPVQSAARPALPGHILAHADAVANANDGAPGVDGESFARIEANGRQSRLDRLREGVRTKRCRPEAVRRMMLKRGMMREPDATARMIEAYLHDRVRDCLAGRGIRHIREDAGFGALGVPRRRLRRNTSATCA
jgi:hypothetical protein